MRITPSGATGTFRSAMTPVDASYSADVAQHVETQRIIYTVPTATAAHITECNVDVVNTNAGGGGVDDFGGRVTIQKVGGAETTVGQYNMFYNALGAGGGMMQVKDTWLETGDIVRAYTHDLRTTSAASYNINIAIDELAI